MSAEIETRMAREMRQNLWDATGKPWYDEARVEAVARRLCALDFTAGRDPDALFYPGVPLILRNGFVTCTEPRPLWTAYADDARRALRVICCEGEGEL